MHQPLTDMLHAAKGQLMRVAIYWDHRQVELFFLEDTCHILIHALDTCPLTRFMQSAVSSLKNMCNSLPQKG